MDKQGSESLAELRGRLSEISDLKAAEATLYWDQATQMPPGGAVARGRQLATLTSIAHAKSTDPELGRLLDRLERELSLNIDDTSSGDVDDDVALVRVARIDYDRATRVPADFMSDLAQHRAASYNTWAIARPQNDFARVQPFLEKTLDLSRRYSDFFPGYTHLADPHISVSDYGMSVATILPLFEELRQQLVPMVQAIGEQQAVDDSCLHREFSEIEQIAFGEDVIRRIGYDFGRGRQDLTHHPFMITFSLGDVRITTRVDKNRLEEALFGTIHECGHALYEQGIDMAYDATPLASGTSSAVHESQSRLWENIVGRSRGFWRHFYPELQTTFPSQLGGVPLDEFYRAINKVQRSLIRTDADEITYNLHVIIRFGLELDLLDGKLSVADLPDAWHARYQENLGLSASDDVDGVLQDVHWYDGFIGGAFQGYTLGNILASQFYAAALAAHPEIPGQIENGQFATLHGWLRENIYRHGRKYTTAELVERTTGGPLQLQPYLDYLRTKYGELYEL